MATRNNHGNKTLNPVPIHALRTVCDPGSLGFSSTNELEPIDSLIGQERALGAISFGASIDQPGYNLFALGPQGTGRHTAILSYLHGKAADEPAPDDKAKRKAEREARRKARKEAKSNSQKNSDK